MTDKELEKLWQELGDVPVNEDDELDQDFHIWERGTDKMEVWLWFDKRHSKGVAQGLLKLKENGKNERKEISLLCP